MKIRAGYEISYDCPQPTPMILTLSVHPSRFADLITLDRMRLDPPIVPNTYHDSFGNFCHVIHAPAGRLTMSADFVVQDNGAPDETAPRRGAARAGRPAGGGSDLSARQPLLRDRSLVEYGVVAVRPGSERLAAGSSDLRLRPRPHHIRLRARQPDQNRLGGVCRAARRLPRLRPSRGDAMPLHERAGALLHRLSRRHRRAARSVADGFFRLVRSLSRRPLVHLRRPPQHAAHRPHPDGARPRRHRRRHRHLVRAVHAWWASR